MKKLFEKITELGGTEQNPKNTRDIQPFDLNESVQQLESRYNARLPEEYVALQKRIGGFSFKKHVVVEAVGHHPILTSDKLVTLNYFYGLEPEGENSVYKWIRNYEDRIPATFLPVCDGQMNDLICIDLAPANYGKVYFWVSDINPEEEEETFLLANSFSELILNASVEEEEDEEEDAETPEIDWNDEKYKKMNPILLEMLKKHHAKNKK